MEYFALALTYGNKIIKGNITIAETDFEDIKFKAISLDSTPTTILPIVKTNNVINVTHKEIDEWENIDNLEAIVQGNGKDTFGVWYFATDYAENRHLYNTQKNLNIKISGIAFVLDTHNEGYTAYLPSSDLKNFGCFDFIGVLEDFKPTYLFEDKSLKGYILKVRLITHPEIEDFFTIDMYVVEENMRMKDLYKGMKVSGMFQMQGQIAQ